MPIESRFFTSGEELLTPDQYNKIVDGIKLFLNYSTKRVSVPPTTINKPSTQGRAIEIMAGGGSSGKKAQEISIEQRSAAARANPRWVPNNEAPNCMICDETFGMFKRKHHCRRCGWMVCEECSKEKLTLNRWLESEEPHNLRDDSSGGALRVCDMCYRDAQRDKAAAKAADLMADLMDVQQRDEAAAKAADLMADLMDDIDEEPSQQQRDEDAARVSDLMDEIDEEPSETTSTETTPKGSASALHPDKSESAMAEPSAMVEASAMAEPSAAETGPRAYNEALGVLTKVNMEPMLPSSKNPRKGPCTDLGPLKGSINLKRMNELKLDLVLSFGGENLEAMVGEFSCQEDDQTFVEFLEEVGGDIHWAANKMCEYRREKEGIVWDLKMIEVLGSTEFRKKLKIMKFAKEQSIDHYIFDCLKHLPPFIHVLLNLYIMCPRFRNVGDEEVSPQDIFKKYTDLKGQFGVEETLYSDDKGFLNVSELALHIYTKNYSDTLTICINLASTPVQELKSALDGLVSGDHELYTHAISQKTHCDYNSLGDYARLIGEQWTAIEGGQGAELTHRIPEWPGRDEKQIGFLFRGCGEMTHLKEEDLKPGSEIFQVCCSSWTSRPSIACQFATRSTEETSTNPNFFIARHLHEGTSRIIQNISFIPGEYETIVNFCVKLDVLNVSNVKSEVREGEEPDGRTISYQEWESQIKQEFDIILRGTEIARDGYSIPVTEYLLSKMNQKQLMELCQKKKISKVTDKSSKKELIQLVIESEEEKYWAGIGRRGPEHAEHGSIIEEFVKNKSKDPGQYVRIIVVDIYQDEKVRGGSGHALGAFSVPSLDTSAKAAQLSPIPTAKSMAPRPSAEKTFKLGSEVIYNRKRGTIIDIREEDKADIRWPTDGTGNPETLESIPLTELEIYIHSGGRRSKNRTKSRRSKRRISKLRRSKRRTTKRRKSKRRKSKRRKSKRRRSTKRKRR